MTGQRWWQILPLGPAGAGESPYQSPSSFAGNPLLVSPEGLASEGWLRQEELDAVAPDESERVDFARVKALKERLFRLAFTRFDASDERYQEFRRREKGWLEDDILFQALHVERAGQSWQDWDRPLALREAGAIAEARDRLRIEIDYQAFLQFAFDLQWRSLRARARELGVGIIGDVPIYVALDSSDVWTRPDLFILDPNGKPPVVAGVPPDGFSADGQVWGNPLYRWEAHEKEGFRWWVDRLRRTLERMDLVRLDHFRGFEGYCEIDAGSRTAHGARYWIPAPGAALLQKVEEELGRLPIIAEDLGVITDAVEKLREEFGLPGMKVLQFAFAGGEGANKYLPFNYPPHCVVYTGTHDNDTTAGWYQGSPGERPKEVGESTYERELVLRMTGTDGREVHWDLIRLAFGSVADTVIIPMQDVLGLDSRARMNIPGTGTGNWGWRMSWRQLRDRVARDRLAEMTATYYRFQGEVPVPLRPRKV